MRQHHVRFAVLIPHASEHGDEDALEREAPAHHPSADEPLDERGHLKLLLRKAETEVAYYRACLRGDEQAAEEANTEWQRLDKQTSKRGPVHDEPDDGDDEDYGDEQR